MTSNACFGSSSVASTSIGLRDGSSPTPIARAMAGMTRSVSATLPSGTNQAPSGYSSARLAATCSARRVLPVPPGPVSVTSRVLARSARDLVELALPPHERRQLHRQVVGPCVERADRREVRGQAVDHELRDPFRPQVLEPVGAERPQGQARRQTAVDQRRGRLGEQHLAAVARGADARRAVHVVADVRAIGVELAFASVQAHADPDRAAVGPRLCLQRPLHVGHGRGRRCGVGEDREESVALDLVLDPTMGDERIPDDRAVTGQQRPPRRGAERRRPAASSPRCR